MKNLKVLFVALAINAIALTGCGGGDKPVTDPEKTITVKLLLGGYGDKWLRETITNFEKVYANEGYKINLLNPTKQNSGVQVKNELTAGYAKKKIDLYFTGDLAVTDLVNTKDGTLIEDLNDVYNQSPISFDGTLENIKVIDKLDSSFGEAWYKYKGTPYNFFYQKSIGALVVNKDKLKSFGFDLPVTTREFFDQIQAITVKNLNGETKVKPFTTVKGTGYASVMLNTWFRQYSGLDKWNTFWSMNNPDGSYNTTDGYKVYDDEGLRKACELIFHTYDYNNFLKGAQDASLSQAHASIMKDKEDLGAVFLFDGDWALNETAADYSREQLKALSFINVPIISELGTKLWGPGTSLNISDEAKVDNILKKVAVMSDEGKEISEIIEAVKSEFSVTLSNEDVKYVCEARGVYNNRGVQTGNAYIAKGVSATHKDIACKLLRMIASDDFAQMYFEKSNCFSPYSKTVDFDESKLLPFSISFAKMATHKYSSVIWPQSTGLRANISELSVAFPNQQYFHSYALENEGTCYVEVSEKHYEFDPSKMNTVYRDSSLARIEENINQIHLKWADWTRGL